MDEQIKIEFLKAYEDYSDELFRHIYFRVYDRDLAKDLLQEAFQNIWIYLNKGKKVENLRAFLHKTVRNAVVSHHRKRKQLSLDELMENGFQPSEGAVEEKCSIKLEAQRVIKAISSVPKKYQEIMKMRYLEDLSIKEIAELTGCTENLVGVRINRGLGKVRKILGIN